MSPKRSGALNDHASSTALLRRGRAIFNAPPTPIPFTGEAEADALLNDLRHYPHAFVLSCIVNLQVKAETAWRMPLELRNRIGSFEFDDLSRLSRAKLRRYFLKPSSLHRFGEVMADRVHAGIARIRDYYDGNAALIWGKRPSSASVVRRFLEFNGVGQKISTFAANCLAREFKVPFSDYYSIDVSVDVHVRRVLTRLGLVREGASNEEILFRAREMNPTFPGLIDLPLWELGKSWCKAINPRCPECPMQKLCPTSKGTIA